MVFTREDGDFHGRTVSFREGTSLVLDMQILQREILCFKGWRDTWGVFIWSCDNNYTSAFFLENIHMGRSYTNRFYTTTVACVTEQIPL